VDVGILTRIARYSRENDFSFFFPTDGMLDQAQSALEVTLPSQYLDFLREFGEGGFNGFYVFGFDRAGSPSFVEETLECREFGLPAALVVIEDCDEWLYCLDCNDGAVVAWVMGEGVGPAYRDFGGYLSERLEDAIGNL